MTTLKLLVPINLDVLVVNNNTTTLWKDISLTIDNLKETEYSNYRGLGTYLEKRIQTPGLKNDIGKVIEDGIHLHWTLPNSFRKGTYQEDGSLDFPKAPNRWLIIRMDQDQNCKSWIVESDKINKVKNAKCNWIGENKKDKGLVPLSIGNSSSFIEWNENAEEPAIDLTIMAPGNPDFAASYMHCKNVFGFYDDMKDETEKPLTLGTDYTYQVYGWFSNQKKDPLNECNDLEKLKETLGKLSFSIENVKEITKNNNIDGLVCHAMINTVPWLKKSTDIIPSTVSIGIGNSTSEAMASLLLANSKSSEKAMPDKLLGAYQYKAMEENGIEGDGLNLLRKQVHARSFQPVNGGTLWVVEAKDKKKGPEQKDENDFGIIPFPPEVSEALKELNELQHTYDNCANKLTSNQAELYALKYKKAYMKSIDSQTDGLDTKTLTKAINDGIIEIKTNINLLNTDLKKLKEKSKALDDKGKAIYTGDIVNKFKKLQNLLPEHDVKEVPMPKFYEPADPAVVIAGLKPAIKYINTNEVIQCRVRTQLANQFIFGIGYITTDDLATAATRKIMDKVASTSVPNDIKELILESFLLNPLTAGFVAKALRADISAVKDVINQFEENASSYARQDKQPCYLPKFAEKKWKQPWNPLYLEWGVKWESSYQKNHVNALKGWKFGDAKNAIDFKYDVKLKSTNAPITEYNGRVLLSNQLVNKVKELNDKLKLELFNDFSPMSQTLSGFGSQLLMRYHGLQLPIVNNDLKIDLEDYQIINDQNPWSPMMMGYSFYPVRSGLLKVAMLRVIDSFGQVLEVFPGKKSLLSSGKELMKSSAGMLKTEESIEFKLGPRIIQPTRLRFEWINKNSFNPRVTDSDPATSPLCGWFLYNKLDDNISVYNARGVELGILVDKGDKTVDLVKAPGCNQLGHFTDNALRNTVLFMRENSTNYNKVKERLISVTEKMQSVASRQQLTMALPIGFPIAVATARFVVELKDLPAHDQSFSAVISKTKFDPIKYTLNIGNDLNKADGLSGYFLNENYNEFKKPVDENSGAPTVEFETGMVQQLTLLLDPRAMVSLSSGILPMATYTLPPHAFTRELKNLNLRFLATPVISPVANLKIPLLQRNDISWDFIRNTTTDEDIIGDTGKSQLRFDSVYAIEGWLKMTQKETEDVDQKSQS
ncbi:hypothetical protein FA048_16480 [Pedobacter polaris]|uniref:Uncharacterized protein n=1 Tax=Pedobacter polaris TaxID=2571273 RepID=A0A4U1CN83_9SPHI|nr:hypothetical protein [Pedobacter polaris]TKC06793.1 hypothetical protein FA048_16480 [Pedobacter polaris]